MDVSKEILKGLLDTLVLYVIEQKPKHGYLIAKSIGEMANGQMEIQDGTLYPILHRLEKKGLIRGGWLSDGTARKRREYKITAAGETTLRDQAGQWRFIASMLNQVAKDVL
jgi:PadR family transcriptional regulator, regulatory protein PadR